MLICILSFHININQPLDARSNFNNCWNLSVRLYPSLLDGSRVGYQPDCQLGWSSEYVRQASREAAKSGQFIGQFFWVTGDPNGHQRVKHYAYVYALTYRSLQYNKPSSISDLLTMQPTHSTRSSAVVTLQRPSNPSKLKSSDRSFYVQAPALCIALPHHLRSHSHSSQSHSLLSLSSQFHNHKQLKIHFFLHSCPP